MRIPDLDTVAVRNELLVFSRHFTRAQDQNPKALAGTPLLFL
jgi:hypothetical protein